MTYFLLLALTLGLMSCSARQEMSAISANNKGVLLLKADSVSGAQQNFTEALSLDPFEATVHNNLGVSFDAAKDIEKALKSYSFAEENADQEKVKFTARFNLAQGLAKQSKIDEALLWYQKALDINPNSQETKTNIELLTSQQKSGGGKGENKNKDDKNKDKDKKPDDKKDKDDKNKDKDQDKKEEPKDYQGSEKYKPRPFKGELSESDVKKILGELKQQEQKIRADYNRKDAKEQPRDKDW